VDLLQRPERISRPEPVEDKGTPWISSLKEKDIDLSVFKQLTASRREFATRYHNCHSPRIHSNFHFRLDNYLRGCTWAPDGLCILSNSHDNILRLFNLPRGLLTGQFNNIEPEMESVLQIPEGEAIYDYAWWPLMNSMDPPTCCFVSTAKSQPIHLFDAFNGKLRATYRIIVSIIFPLKNTHFYVNHPNVDLSACFLESIGRGSNCQFCLFLVMWSSSLRWSRCRISNL